VIIPNENHSGNELIELYSPVVVRVVMKIREEISEIWFP
jgi:hypothetical protein